MAEVYHFTSTENEADAKCCFPLWKIEAIVENFQILQEEKYLFSPWNTKCFSLPETLSFDDSGNKHYNPNRDKRQGIYLCYSWLLSDYPEAQH